MFVVVTEIIICYLIIYIRITELRKSNFDLPTVIEFICFICTYISDCIEVCV